MSIEASIKQQLTDSRVVLYMKGTPTFPQCGFSGRVAYILQNYGVSFKAVNVLESDEIREGIKAFSQWPTLPQLYIDGKFVGGCDIVTDLHERGELEKMLTTTSHVSS